MDQRIALFDSRHSRKLQLSGGLILVASLCGLSGFYVDLIYRLELASPFPWIDKWLQVLTGMAVALFVPVAGACAGVPERTQTKWWWSKKIYVSALLLGFGFAIFQARYSKAIQALKEKQRTTTEVERAARIELTRAQSESPEAKARAAILAAQAKMLASAATALESGSKRLTPKVREDAMAMAQLASSHLQEKIPHAPGSVPATETKSKTISTAEVMEVVSGPAMAEFLLAELIALVAISWGGAAFTSIRSREEFLGENRHESLHGVDLALLSHEARMGLEPIEGTWRGLALGEPAERRRGPRAILWPTLAIRDDGPRIFIGSRQAIAHTRTKSSTLNNEGEAHEGT